MQVPEVVVVVPVEPVDVLPLEEPLLLVDTVLEPSPPPPHAATSAAVPPASIQLRTRRRCRV